MPEVKSVVSLTLDIESVCEPTSRAILRELFVLGRGWSGVIQTFGRDKVQEACSLVVSKCLHGGHCNWAHFTVCSNDNDACL